jgi:hypothetical protein
MKENNIFTFNQFLFNSNKNYEDIINIEQSNTQLLYNKRYDIFYNFDNKDDQGYYNKYNGNNIFEYLEYTKVLLFLSNIPKCRLLYNDVFIDVENNLHNINKYLGIKIKRKYFDEYNVTSEWLSSSLITPCVINDDWEMLNKIQNKRKKNNSLKEEGIIFEYKIINIIRNKHKNDFFQIGNSNDATSIDKFNLTIKMMTEGMPFIYQGILHDIENKLIGSVDLIVRSDYLHYLCNDTTILNNINIKDGCLFSNKWHYVIVDIKNKKLKFNADMFSLRNNGNMMYMSKAQIYMYNTILAKIQNYTPCYGFILGNGFIINNFESNKLFEKIGIVDFFYKDNSICKKLNDGIKIANTYSNIDLMSPPKEIMINVKNQYDTSDIKKQIAHIKGDISMLPFLTYKHRNLAKKNKIYSWREINCNSKNLGITGKQAELLDKFIIANRENKFFIKYNKLTGFLPIFIDFESVYTDKEYIYMIGMVYQLNNITYEEQFYCQYLNDINEQNMFKLFEQRLNFLREKNSLRLYHWGNFEPCKSKIKNLEWYNMINIFKDNQIVFPGMFNYKLKDITNVMYNHNMIKSKYEGKINNGYESIFEAIKYYKTRDINILESIKKYNLIDCKVLKEIYDFLNI